MDETVHVVVMAKPPVAGQVKTRLQGALTPEQAAGVHEAMLTCVLTRVLGVLDSGLPLVGEGVLALATPGLEAWPGFRQIAGQQRWRVLDQGSGDLGTRLSYVWQTLGGGRIVFLGSDSPDVPADHLRSALLSTITHDAAAGRTDDGGYWTLAAARHHPALLRGIDWGTPSVYHQTTTAAAGAGLRFTPLPPWHDVDEPTDLDALRRRLDQRLADLTQPSDPALATLRRRLTELLEQYP